jgi:glycosyltransferase 2 family protein
LLAVLLSKPLPGFSILKKVYDSFCKYRDAPLNLALAWFLSVVIQGSAILYMWYIANLLGMTESIGLGVFMSLIPLGILTTALPLAPGGMGVGHVAFDRLLALVGIEGGANIFNIFFLGQMSLNLLGVVPYLLFKKPTDDEMAEQSVVK